MAKIKSIEAHQILDSRNKPTLEVKIVTTDGMMVLDSVPSGTSTGSFEAVAINPKVAMENVNNVIAPKLIGMDPTDQEAIDQILLDLDGTKDKSKLGANAILGVSLAVSRAGAFSLKLPLYKYLNDLYNKMFSKNVKPSIPTPMMVMIEGGKHADNNICIQEFLCITSIEKGQKIWYRLKEVLNKHGLKTTLGLEGGFTPELKYDEDAFTYIQEAIEAENLNIPHDVQIGVDFAANYCQIDPENIKALFKRYPIYSMEDPLKENDWDHWSELKYELNQTKKTHLLVGDDLFVTSEKRLEKGLNSSAANAIIIKVNQVGTLTETLKVINMAQDKNMVHILSHRSGETMDTYIADLAVATGAEYIKSGAPLASERMVKYNRIREIEQEIL